LGAFRFLLATFVMLSHIPGGLLRSNHGASSVLAFYFLSGWLMAMSYRRFMEKTDRPARAFYLDRFIKLWPSYILVFAVALVFYANTGMQTFDWRRVMLEIFLVPNAFTKMIPWHEHGLNIVQPSWSLGVECIFYLTVPLLIALPYRFKLVAAYVMAIGHLAVLSSPAVIGDFIDCTPPIRESFCSVPVSDYLGMDMPIFAGVTFLLGHIAYDRFRGRPERKDRHLFFIWGLYVVYWLAIATPFGLFQFVGTVDVMLGMVLFLPAALLSILWSLDRKQPRLDRILGDLAYPLFLVHVLARHIDEYLFGDGSPLRIIALALVLAVIVMLFQTRLIDRLRYGVRGFGAPQREPAAAGIG
jgi:peptidoglycan/LPS O-acetylase OafA/YrhL